MARDLPSRHDGHPRPSPSQSCYTRNSGTRREPVLARFLSAIVSKRKSGTSQIGSRNGTSAIVWDVASAAHAYQAELHRAEPEGHAATTKETGPGGRALARFGALWSERGRHL
jgi:hypothetical protein